MAEHLANIFGTEKDRVNCPFYYKIGACRHGERCSRQHNKPQISQSILLRKLYSNPYPGIEGVTTNPQVQEDFDEFYEDIFDELSKFGRIDEMTVCDNICEHLQGNVYVKFYEEDDAEKAIQGLTGRFYAGKPILPEFSPVTDFREASCRQQSMGGCDRGGQCNFIHVKPPSVELELQLFGRRKSRHRRYDDDDDRRRGGRDHRGHRDHRRSRSRSRSRSSSRDRRHHRSHRDHRRSRSRERDRDDYRGDRDRDRDHRDDRGRDGRDHHSREDARDYRREPRGDEREREGRRDYRSDARDRDRERERDRDDSDRGRSVSTSGTN